jgi:hypothetical protein
MSARVPAAAKNFIEDEFMSERPPVSANVNLARLCVIPSREDGEGPHGCNFRDRENVMSPLTANAFSYAQAI